MALPTALAMPFIKDEKIVSPKAAIYLDIIDPTTVAKLLPTCSLVFQLYISIVPIISIVGAISVAIFPRSLGPINSDGP